jgi:hypothetical protein
LGYSLGDRQWVRADLLYTALEVVSNRPKTPQKHQYSLAGPQEWNAVAKALAKSIKIAAH